MKVNFHDHLLHRHPILNKNQWTCHANLDNPKFKAWINSTKEKYKPHEGCLSGIKGIVQDNRKYQGFECYQTDFDVCLECLMYYKDIKSEKEIDTELRRDFRRSLRHPHLKTIEEREKEDPFIKEETHEHKHEHHHLPIKK
jgi:hypothetical protein